MTLLWRAAARGDWHADPDAAVAQARGWGGTDEAWIECSDGARVELADVLPAGDGDDLPPNPWAGGGEVGDAFEVARVLWRALDALDVDGVLAALHALDADDLRMLVLIRALLDRKDAAREAGA